MKLEYLIAIGVRLFAIGLGVNVLRSFSLIPVYLSSTSSHADLILFYGTTIAFALLAIVLWKFPLIIAQKIANFPSQDETSLRDDAYIKLLEVGLILLGMYLLYFVISDGVYWLIFYLSIASSEYYDSANAIAPDQVASMVTTIVELVVASILVFSHQGLAKLIWKLRGA